MNGALVIGPFPWTIQILGQIYPLDVKAILDKLGHAVSFKITTKEYSINTHKLFCINCVKFEKNNGITYCYSFKCTIHVILIIIE